MTEQLTFELTEKFTCAGCLDDHPVENKVIGVDGNEYCPWAADLVKEEYGTSRKPLSLATRHSKEGQSTTILRKSIPRGKKRGHSGVTKR